MTQAFIEVQNGVHKGVTNGHANGHARAVTLNGHDERTYKPDNVAFPTIPDPAPITADLAKILRVEGDQITLNGEPIVMRGACLGGWMAMENFMTGYPAHEHQMRQGLLDVLGQAKYDFYFDKFLEYFFTDSDAKACKDMGFNLIRISINYKHFEDDMQPRVFKPKGLKHLDRVVDICARHGIYSVIDLHSLPGGQNIDWHSDNPTDKALFWAHKDFQDRGVILWEHLAEHYKNNTWVAGYNVFNEPVEPTNKILAGVMERFERAIRAIDPNHILFWDGNGFGSDFRSFGKPFPNSVYACHDYSSLALGGSEEFTGSQDQKAKLVQSFEWKSEYQRKIGGPVWNGEFGVTFVDPELNANAEEINEHRYALLIEQLKIYDSFPNVSWTIWCWKDIGTCGLLKVDPKSAYMSLLKPFLAKKREAAIDSWGVDASHLDHLFKPMWNWLCEMAPSMRDRYPKVFGGDRGKHLFRPVRLCLLAEEMVPEYCEYFRGKSFEELDQLARSFHFDNCIQRDKLVDMLTSFSQKGSSE